MEEACGRLDILVNNAGIWVEKEGYEGDSLRDTFEVNTFAPFLMTEAFLPKFIRHIADYCGPAYRATR
jgi:NAD(P)-dependent dehydrogenase (short-subunit alcohol dehydrogenase family)